MNVGARNRSVSAAIGEYLVLGELLKRDMEAYLAHGETQKGWDIVLLGHVKALRVQVKTINWPKEKAVNGDFSGFDILVVVLLDKNKARSRFFVFSQNEMEGVLSKKNVTRKNGKRTLTMSNRWIQNHIDFEDCWTKVSCF